jgi:hypothetical protein
VVALIFEGFWLVSVLTVMAQPAVGEPQRVLSAPTAWLHRLDIDQLDPKQKENLPKITLLLRSEDIPRTRRLEYARRYLRGECKFPITTLTHDPSVDGNYRYVLNAAISAIGRLDDTESIALLETKLAQWEEEQQKPPHEQHGVIPNTLAARVVLARLKAVREVPTVKSSADLINRLETMVRYAGFEGSVDKWLLELKKEINFTYRAADLGAGIHERILWQYMQMLLASGWQGIDITAAAQIIQFGSEPIYTVPRERFETVVQLAKMPREQAVRRIVEESPQWEVISDVEEIKAQVLLDMGTSVVPLVWSKLEWAARHRDQIKGNGMGLVALLEVLVTLGGEQALPLIEPFTRDENEWVRYYACRAKEYIQQGKVFRFAPYF